MQDSLYNIIEELPLAFIEKVKATDDVATLLRMRKNTACYNRRAVIDARIENINYLVS
ncbi:hypothetical protein [Maribacter dokdonensis]|uniref:hypothetical protein n=1 Tax=Maribacter dokdonensis TaxID=320912 RepID=UPI0012FCCA17|nr:hypothetical protein [Maribacter dokdonensis]